MSVSIFKLHHKTILRDTVFNSETDEAGFFLMKPCF